MAFEHHDDSATSGQFGRRLLGLAARQTRLAARQSLKLSGMGRQNPRAARASKRVGLLGQGIERIGIEHRRGREIPVEPGHELRQIGRTPKSRPAANRRGLGRQFLDGVLSLTGNASLVIGRQGAVMYDGSNEATTSRHASGMARRTNPAPPRSAAMPASETAPVMPRDPPISSARPKSPLWLSGARGGS